METMIFWHGGDLSDINNTFKQQTKKQEYGPGLYLTTSYNVVKKYIKGSRKLYRVEVALGNSLERTDIPYDNVLEFLYKLPRSISIKLKDKFDEYNKNGFVSAEIINNVFVNNNLLKPEISYKLKQFYLENNIDYSLVVNAFGWGEDMMILFNTNKIINVERIGPKDKIDKFELHKEGMEVSKKQLQENYNPSDFNNIPELSQIGTEEQYSAYLDTIFPSSKINQIMYHKTSAEKFDEFKVSRLGGVYFSFFDVPTRAGFIGKMIAKLTKERMVLAKVNVINPFIINRNNYKDIEKKTGGATQSVTELGKKYDLSGYDSILGYPNPLYDKGELDKFPQINFIEGRRKDLIELAVFNPKNIHILGSKQDIEGFRNFVNRNKKTQLEGMEISKKELIQNKKLKKDAEDVNFMGEITKGELEEAKKKKGDRCTRIAKSKYDVWPSAYASGAVVKCRQGKIWKGLKEEEENNIDKRKIYVLVGPPSVGKSTWIKNTFGSIQPYVISRDNIVEQISDNLGWTYDDLFVAPPQGSQLGDYDEKYGEVIKSPSYMSWQPLSFSKVLEANNQVHVSFTKLVSNAVNSDKDIVVDMTNMTAGARKNALKAIEGNENLFEKIAVVFPFEGAEEIIIDVARKRAEAAKRMGKSKTLPDSVMRKMFASFQNVSPEEGFDKVIQQDNRELLSTLNEKWSKKYKRSIDCNNPKGFSQKAHCKGRLKEEKTTKGKIRFENEHLDHYDGQDNYELGIYEDEEIIGYVQYVIFENEITVSDILVRPNRRRENFGSMLIQKMKQLHPYAKYKPSLKTDLGSKFIHKDVDVNEQLDEKTDFSKEKKQGLHGWFARQGGKGKSKGWVDCNTCRDGKCKSCGRKEGESRSKYPACRPTPSACKTKGKGKSWGKKSTNEDVLNEQSKQDIEKEIKLNEIKNTFKRLIK